MKKKVGNKREKTAGRHGKKYAGLVLLAFVLYIVLGAIAPHLKRPKVTEETKREIADTTFFGEAPSGERACILADNGEALAERIRLVSQAQDRVILSTFDFKTDESGKDMLAALSAAADRGVQVQVLVDGVSGFTRLKGNPYFQALSGRENAQIRIYNSINLLMPWRSMGRLHDKYLIVDEKAYVLGGRNTYDFFLGDYGGYINYDWDVLVYQEEPVEGGSMEQLTDYFAGVWELPLCRTYHDEEKVLSKKSVIRAGEELAARYEDMQEEHADWFVPCDYTEKTKPANHIQLISGPTGCYEKEPVVYEAITQLMEQAKEEVHFHTPYIICDDWMQERLKEVCQSAPKVTMMTNSVANNGNPFGAMDYQKNREKILGTGVHILEYDGGVSYHGKCFAIDDRLIGVGSFNWDIRSAYIDTELMLVVDSRELNAELRAGMAEYEKEALTVVDAERSVAPEGMEAQKLSFESALRIGLLRVFGWWARFLM